MRFALAFFLALFVSQTCAEVPWRPMLQGLLERQYYDVAIDYLESLGQTAKCPDDLKNQIDLQIALVHFEALSQGKAPLGTEYHFARAKNALQRFLQEHPDSEEAYLANRDLGKLLLEELRQLTVRIHAAGITSAQQESLRNQAEEKYADAEKLLRQAERIAYNTAKTLRDDPSAKTDPARAAKRDAANMQVLEVRGLLAGLPRQRAKIYPRGSVEYRQFMEDAAFLCKEVVQKYGDYTGSLDAKLMEAQSYFDLGEDHQARILLRELNVLSPTTPQFRAILAEAFPLMLELNLKEPTPENLVDSRQRILRWTEQTTPSQRSNPFYAKANLLAGETYLKLAQNEKNDDSPGAKQYRTLAVGYLNAVAATSPESKEALKLLASLTDASSISVTPEIPETFADAKLQAERKFQEFLLAERTPVETSDPHEIARAEMYRNQIAAQAIEAFRAALAFDADAADLNAIRVKLATVYWSQGRWEEVIVIGDYLMKHYAATTYGPQGADFSIKAARRLFLDEFAYAKKTQATPDPATRQRFEKTYDTIVARWETFPVGQEAISLRIETELDLGSLEQAKKFLETIPADSDRRATAELKFGLAIWALYVKSPASPEEDQTKNDSPLDEARLYLEKGLAAKRLAVQSGAAINFTTVSACVVLAQIELANKNPQAASRILSDPDFGPMMLLDQQRQRTATFPIFSSPDWNGMFKSQILTVAIRTALDAEQYDQAKMLVERLDSLLTEEPLEIYVALGKLLDSRLKFLQSDNRTAEFESLATTFDAFLNMFQKLVDSRKADVNETALLWLADTYYRLGDEAVVSLIEPVEPPERAVAYFEQAESLYESVAERSSQADALLRFKLALVRRGQGKYGDAYEILADLIRESENRLNVQMEAARTLQLWGKADKDLYVKAIVGDGVKKPDGHYEIWGWNWIIRKTSTNLEKYRSEFFEAHFNKTVCRLLLVRELSGPDAERQLEGAKNDLNRLEQLHPNFGGDPWTARFAELRRFAARLASR
ncbi:MAG: tetratricopeptide repeat protein [Planctomycetaceae bacterium]|nr:tetratricopeptide repeat protein [Planctomycetaceae bacterium]